ncbi:MAG: hypothetical protein ACOX2L_02820 [Anaerolineae bacterium]|jgi:beta-phosphoglucomutase-like phosphatase (HAD superfamily)|nr:hypothetical protein [Chloroflexota bacterium]
MRAVFIHQASLLRDSHIDTVDPEPDWKLMPATIEAVRMLRNGEGFVVLCGAQSDGVDPSAEGAAMSRRLAESSSQLQAGGGQVDVSITFSDLPDVRGERAAAPGIVWAAVRRFGLQPEHCYLLADSLEDVYTAQQAGVRPIVILGKRSIEDVFGRADLERDFPVASDLSTAVQYIQVEEEITRHVGEPRSVPATVTPEALAEGEARVKSMVLLSERARELEEQTGRARVERSDIARWLFFITFGALGLSLGIAYLLTHLYRMQPFPQFVYYLTLQFISRPMRGLLFILIGAGVLALVLRSIIRSGILSEWLAEARKIIR